MRDELDAMLEEAMAKVIHDYGKDLSVMILIVDHEDMKFRTTANVSMEAQKRLIDLCKVGMDRDAGIDVSAPIQ